VTSPKTDKNAGPTVHIAALGCAKNQVDAEVMAGQLNTLGARIVDDPEDAEVLVVHTCTFIEDASQESVDVVLELARHREQGRCRKLVLSGCLAERYGEKLLELMPEVDLVAGTGAVHQVAEMCLDDQAGVVRPPPQCAALDGAVRAGMPQGGSAFVKVGEGCSQQCSFCIIPQLRGPLRTRPVASIVAEVRELVENGVREVNLIGQDTTAFGRDRGKVRLPDLLWALDDVEGLDWIRILYAYPARFSDRLIEAIREGQRVVPYVDVPLQHVDGGVLKGMGRGTSEKTVRELVERLRAGIPGVALRTTFLVGFPGESESAFGKLMDFASEARFERMGVFPFSAEEGTPAAQLPGQLPEDVREERQAALMALQEGIHLEHNEALVGSRQRVLVEGLEQGPLWTGRTALQAPEVDGCVILDGGDLEAGQMIDATITGVDGYDLVASLARQGEG